MLQKVLKFAKYAVAVLAFFAPIMPKFMLAQSAAGRRIPYSQLATFVTLTLALSLMSQKVRYNLSVVDPQAKLTLALLFLSSFPWFSCAGSWHTGGRRREKPIPVLKKTGFFTAVLVIVKWCFKIDDVRKEKGKGTYISPASKSSPS